MTKTNLNLIQLQVNNFKKKKINIFKTLNIMLCHNKIYNLFKYYLT